MLKLQILSSISNIASVTKPGFPIFLALIILLLMPFLAVQEEDLDKTRAMNTVYLLLVIGVVWKFIRYIRGKS
jgi:heme/copper-type cytochrome/quinol oxidase subunit 4